MVDFRVARFERKGGCQVFVGFPSGGYFLGQNGILYRGEIISNTTDRRKKDFHIVDFFSGRCDENKQKIYAHDVVYSSTLKTSGIVLFRPEKGAFIFCVQRGKITIPYSFLDMYEVSLKKKYSIFEKNVLTSNP